MKGQVCSSELLFSLQRSKWLHFLIRWVNWTVKLVRIVCLIHNSVSITTWYWQHTVSLVNGQYHLCTVFLEGKSDWQFEIILGIIYVKCVFLLFSIFQLKLLNLPCSLLYLHFSRHNFLSHAPIILIGLGVSCLLPTILPSLSLLLLHWLWCTLSLHIYSSISLALLSTLPKNLLPPMLFLKHINLPWVLRRKDFNSDCTFGRGSQCCKTGQLWWSHKPLMSVTWFVSKSFRYNPLLWPITGEQEYHIESLMWGGEK